MTELLPGQSCWKGQQVSSMESRYPGPPAVPPGSTSPSMCCLMLHAATRARLRAGFVTRSNCGGKGEAQDPWISSRKGQPHSRSLSRWTELFSIVLVRSSFKLLSWGQFHWLWECSISCNSSCALSPCGCSHSLSPPLIGRSHWIFCLMTLRVRLPQIPSPGKQSCPVADVEGERDWFGP